MWRVKTITGIDKTLALTLLQLCQFVFNNYSDETLAIPLLYQFVLIC